MDTLRPGWVTHATVPPEESTVETFVECGDCGPGRTADSIEKEICMLFLMIKFRYHKPLIKSTGISLVPDSQFLKPFPKEQS